MKTPDKAGTLDEYIDHMKSSFHSTDLRGLRPLVPQLREKGEAAGAAGHPDVVQGVRILEQVICSEEAEQSGDPLPQHLAEAGVAAAYLLKGIDIIPDMVPNIGFSDDAWVVARVLQRNPVLTGAA
jgi:hypothetical protein